MKHIQYLVIAICSIALLWSCSDDDAIGNEIYKGADFIGFNDSSLSLPEDSANPLLVSVNISKSQSQDVVIPVTLTPINAVEGVDYVIPGNITSVTIPAGAFTAGFEVQAVNNDVSDSPRSLKFELGTPNVANLQVGIVGSGGVSTSELTINIIDDDCPEQPACVWWTNLTIEDVGFGFVGPNTGSSNNASDANVVIINSDLPNAGVASPDFEFVLQPTSATGGTVRVDATPYCSACSNGLDALYEASGTYDVTTKTIVVNYRFFRSDNSGIWTGTNVITPS